MSEVKPARRWTKWVVKGLLGVLVAIVVLLVIAAVLLATGWPQRTAIEKVLGNALNANITVGSVSTFGKISISDLKAFDKTTASGSAEPMLDVDGLKLDYTLWPKDKRYFPALTVDKLGVRLDRAAPARQKAFSKPGAKKKEKMDTMPFIPRAADIASFQFNGDWPAGGFGVNGLHVKSTIDSKNDYTVALAGDGLTGSWWMVDHSMMHELKGGSVDLQVKKGNGETTVEPLKIAVPGLLDVMGRGQFKESGKKEIDVRFDKFVAQDVDLSNAPPGSVRVPFAFKKLDLSGTHLNLIADPKGLKASFAETKLNINVSGLQLGPKDHEWYGGDLAIRGQSGATDKVLLNLDATLNVNQKLHASLEGQILELAAHLDLENWTRDDLLAALPKDMRGALQNVAGFQGVSSAVVDVQFKALTITATATVKPKLAAAEAVGAPVEFSGTASGSALSLIATPQFEVGLRAQVGDGSVNVKTRVGIPGPKRASIAVEQVDPGLWMAALVGPGMLDALRVKVGGSFEYESSDAGRKGSGEVHIAKANAIEDLKGPVVLEDDTLKAAGLSGKLFGGALAADADLGILSADRPVHLTAHVKGMNLESASGLAGVPSFKLTGLADADLTLAADSAGIKELQIAVQSTAPVAVSVAFLEQLLASEYVKQMSDKGQLEQIVAKIVGKEESHPFDAATLSLAWKDDGLAGQVVLKSEQLNLTVDLRIDKASLIQAIKLLPAAG